MTWTYDRWRSLWQQERWIAVAEALEPSIASFPWCSCQRSSYSRRNRGQQDQTGLSDHQEQPIVCVDIFIPADCESASAGNRGRRHCAWLQWPWPDMIATTRQPLPQRAVKGSPVRKKKLTIWMMRLVRYNLIALQGPNFLYEPLSRADKVSQRSQSLESVKNEAIGDDGDAGEAAVAAAMAPAAEPDLAPERGPIRAAREAQGADSADAPAGGAKELPPGAIAQDATPLDGPVEDVTPPSPSPGVSPQEHLSAALRGTEALGFHQWQEVEVASIKGDHEEVIRVYCGIWNLHGKRAPSDLHAWIPPSMRHHIYAIGTCECERSLEKSLIWSSKARWERQMQDYFGQDYRMIGSNTMSAVHLMVFLHRTLWKYCAEVVTCHVATGFANVIGNKGSTQVLGRPQGVMSKIGLWSILICP
eukprot:s1726_g4.t1